MLYPHLFAGIPPHFRLPRWLSEWSRIHCNAGDLGLIPGSDPLEEEMATYSSVLAWEIPWTEEPGGLQSMELERVGHD